MTSNKLGKPSDQEPLVFHRYEWQDRAGRWQQHDCLWGGIISRGTLLLRRSNGEEQLISSNMAYVVRQQTEVLLATPADPLVEIRLYASQAPFAEIVSAGGPDLSPDPVTVLQAPTANECERLSQVRYSPWQATAFWWQLASCQAQPQLSLATLQTPPDWLQQAITACASGKGLRAGTTGLALAARRSPSQVRRVVRSCYGCSATELITQLRLNRARHLLHYTSQSLAEIALSLGWRSEAWFSDVFAQHHAGQRPGSWRRQRNMLNEH